MVKIGIISDTHINNFSDRKYKILIDQLREIFKDVDRVIHAGDICKEELLVELKKIAPVQCVAGENDEIINLKRYIEIKIKQYNIGIIHQLPKDLELFCKEKNLIGGILIYGHTHKPLIKGTPFNVLLLNPGSPTEPKAPNKIKGFKNPIARPSVMILNIEKGIVSTFIINLKFHD